MADRVLTHELSFDATITGVGDMAGHGPAVVLKPSYRKASILPVHVDDLPEWGARIGERVRVRVSREPVR